MASREMKMDVRFVNVMRNQFVFHLYVTKNALMVLSWMTMVVSHVIVLKLYQPNVTRHIVQCIVNMDSLRTLALAVKSVIVMKHHDVVHIHVF